MHNKHLCKHHQTTQFFIPFNYQGTSVYIVNDLYKQPVTIARIMCTSVNLVLAIDEPYRPDPPKGPKSTHTSSDLDTIPDENPLKFFITPNPNPGLNHPSPDFDLDSPPMTPCSTPYSHPESVDRLSQLINIFEKATSDRLTVSSTYPYIFKKDPKIFKNEKESVKNPIKIQKMNKKINEKMNKISYFRLKTEISLNVEQYNHNILIWESIVDPFGVFISCTAPTHQTPGK